MRCLSVALSLCVAAIATVAAGCPAEPAAGPSPLSSSPSSPAAPVAAAPAAHASPARPAPTPEQAVAVVEQFYGQYNDALTPALTALFTDAQRARAESHRSQCAAALQQLKAGKDVDVPVACESDPYLCAQDRLPMAKPRFEAPGTVIVAYTDMPEVQVKVAVKAAAGGWQIDGFTCGGGGG